MGPNGEELWVSYLASFGSGIFSQLIDGAIAVNRFTAVRFYWSHSRLWSGSRFFAIMVTHFVFSIVASGIRPLMTLAQRPNVTLWNLTAEEIAQPLNARDWVSETVYSSIPFCVLGLNVVMYASTLLYFSRLSALQRQMQKNNLSLLVYAIIEELNRLVFIADFACEISRREGEGLCHVIGDYRTNFGNINWFASGIFLIATSSVVRQEYFAFYRLCKKNDTAILKTHAVVRMTTRWPTASA